jgi:class 3 adenylate cyclase
LNWEGVDATVLADLVTIVSSFVPPALAQRLRSTGNVSLAEHRPVTSMFVQFEFAGDEDDSSAIETAEMGRQLQRYYEWAVAVVTRFGLDNARVNRVLTGDKGNQLHIMFGAPVAPDAPDQAVRCALALQREQPAYIASQKIGLTVGKVFSGPVGATARREYTVVGDVVNLSARLMQICQPGGIWTDEVTANRTQQWIDYTALSPVQLKGKQDAIVPYEATTARTTTTQLHAFLDRWQRPLIGREKETDLLLGGMDGALRGVGGIAAISGPTGTGKSRLLAEGIRYWLASGGRGLLGVCYQHLSDSPYAPWQV